MNKFFKLFGLFSFSFLLLSFSGFNDKKIIVIDAGHGGKDLGVNKNGISEKQIVLDIAQRIQKLNKNEKVEIILTRDSDDYKTLVGRTDLINKLKPAMVISLHVNNSKNVGTRGNLIYAKPTNFDSAKKLATKFGDCKVEEADLHLLRNSEAPAMVLELGYLSNVEDQNYLNSKQGRIETSKKILEFITEN